ncbi:MAG: menaquinone biosynthesis protein [Planctomycetales bacterium]|nr:menaquinone biosynthesis protein [Planctomycetales bacterium]
MSYLNSKPLVHGLAELLPDDKLIFDYPSRLADALARQELDVALVPSIELAEHPDWRIVSDACIGCIGPVLSVKLLFRTAPEQVRSLALDEGSRTSAVLAQILLHKQYGLRPKLTRLPIGSGADQVDADAVLLIGDRAIYNDDNQFVEVWDLGDRWVRSTELPMVFAMWVARPEIETDSVAVALSSARDNGCRHLLSIAAEQSEEMQLPLEVVEEYLCRNLHFHLGSDQLRGLESFYQFAAELDLISEPPSVALHDCSIFHS